MEKEILEGNKLIAEFDGWNFLPNGNCWHERFNDHGQQIEMTPNILSQYHTSWDWLMPVVEKIIQMEDVVVTSMNWLIKIEADIPKLKSWQVSSHDYLKKDGATMIGAYYFAVINFIHWYNSTQKP